MLSPKINTKVINVELTSERQKQIISNLAPVTRLINGGRGAVCDVVIRKIHRSWGGAIYSILVRLTADGETYYTVAHERHFGRAVSEAADRLRRSMSKTYYTEAQQIRRLQKTAHEKYFVELFV
tara:strand:+ start:270 stop:641 length:372 start_codon:yes stop_codon:yes gene_type:complete